MAVSVLARWRLKIIIVSLCTCTCQFQHSISCNSVCVLYLIRVHHLHVSLFEDVHVTITLIITSRRELLQRMHTCMYMNMHVGGIYTR